MSEPVKPAPAEIEWEGPLEIARAMLDGQPFGFRWEDVRLLRDTAMEWQTTSRPNGDESLQELADRIEALLRPRKDET